MEEDLFQLALDHWAVGDYIAWDLSEEDQDEYRSMFSYTTGKTHLVDFTDRYLLVQLDVDLHPDDGPILIFSFSDSQERHYAWEWEYYNGPLPFRLSTGAIKEVGL